MKKFLFIFCVLFFGSVYSSESLDQNKENIRQSLEKFLPDLVPDSIKSAGVGNLFEVSFGTRVFYISADGKYLFQGQVIDLKNRIQLTEKREQELKKELLSKLDEKSAIIFQNDNFEYTITVFTDTDCGFCRKLHREIRNYLNKGIKVRYLAYPRSGLKSQTALDMVSVWCSKDRNKALGVVKSGGEIDPSSCINPIATHYKLGQDFAIRGTPAIVLDNGKVISGYVPPDDLIKILKDQNF